MPMDIAFKTLKPEKFSPYRRSAAVETLEPLQLPMNSDATYMRSRLQVQNRSTLAQTTTSLTRRSVVSTAQSNLG